MNGPQRKNLSMVRGDTLAFTVGFIGMEDDLDAAYFTMKRSPDESEPVFQKSIGDGITKADTGLYSVRVAPEDTDDIAPGKYHYDFEVHIGEEVQTILLGIMTVIADITRGA